MKNKNNSRYAHLIGKNKREIIKDLGHESNFYPSDIWSYTLLIKNILLFPKRTMLVLIFKGDTVSEIKIETKYGHCNQL